MRFTVLTPTYNRVQTLGRLYECLCAQTFRDFEWVLVDDGSNDGTRELVSSWEPFFPIRYIWKPNGGKHTAMNLGVSAANGEFVAFVDSDDGPAANALERFDFHWRQIPNPLRFSTLTARCCRPDGSIMGETFPGEFIDEYSFAMQFYRRGRIDRWGINRTDVLKEFPFPEGERFVLEGLIWNRLSRKYATRFFNEPLLVVYPSPDNLTHRMVDLRISSPKATLTYYAELALSPVSISIRFKASINFIRFAALAGLRWLTSSVKVQIRKGRTSGN